jgi:protocatechuate 4,5-dioxygenase alpha chain
MRLCRSVRRQEARYSKTPENPVPSAWNFKCLYAGMRVAEHDTIPGTDIFDGTLALKGYALNKMCFSFNEAANREAFRQDEDAYCQRFGLTREQQAAVKSRNVLELLRVGGNIYYLAKWAGIFGLNVQQMGAQQRGMSEYEFTEMLLHSGGQ